jgi:D-3-phosphoglycerate dehydrogenase
MKILVLSSIWPGTIDQLQQEYECQVSINPFDDEKHSLLADADIVVVRSPVRLDRPALENAPRLKLIVRAGAGLDTIDVAFAKDQGIALVMVPLSADSVAEHTFGLLLSVCRRIPVLHQSLQQGRWEKHSGLGIELCGKTLGIVGFGRIGIRVAEISQALKMDLVAFDRSPDKGYKREAAENLGVRFMSADELFSEADFVSIQMPLNESTRDFVNANRLAMMKPTAVLVNVGRGGIVDEMALYEALRSGDLAGAALDVFEREPLGENPLPSLDNFVGTPHVAAQTVEAQRRVGEDVLKIIQAFSAGHDLSGLGVVL